MFVTNSIRRLIFSSQSSYEGERTGRAEGQLAPPAPSGPANVEPTRGVEKETPPKKKIVTARLGFFFLRARVKS